MIGHITYLSDEQMHAKFGRRLQTRESLGYDFETEFQVESYLKYQGDSFVRRFDANSYLYHHQGHRLLRPGGGYHSLVEAFERVKAEFLVVSFTSDWLFPTTNPRSSSALQANGVPTTFLEIPSTYGHDAFLLPNEQLATAISGFLTQRGTPGQKRGAVDEPPSASQATPGLRAYSGAGAHRCAGPRPGLRRRSVVG